MRKGRYALALLAVAAFLGLSPSPVMAMRAGRAPAELLKETETTLPASKTPRVGAVSSKAWAKIGNVCYNAQGQVIPGAITRGIDVSEWDGVINWSNVANSAVDFVFIRIMDGLSYQDVYYDRNMKGANEAGIPVGTYVYAEAKTDKEALQEAQKAISKMKGYKVSYPVVYDMESPKMSGSLSRTAISRIVMTFCTEIRKAGYTPMVYCNQTWYNRYLDWSIINGMDVWLASYSDRFLTPDRSLYDFTIWQATAGDEVEGHITTRRMISGIPADRNVDIDFGFVDYLKRVIPRTQPVSGYTPSANADQTGQDDDLLSPLLIATGWKTINGKTYYYKNGKPVTGVQSINGNIYCFTSEGVLYTNRLIRNSSGIYYVDAKGLRVRNTFITVGKNTFYFGSDYKAVRGLKRINGKLWYFRSSNGILYKDQKLAGQKTIYYASASGALATSRFVILTENGRKNIYYFGEDGKAVTGFQKINDKTYCFYPSGARLGVMLRNITISIGGYQCSFNSVGELISRKKTA
ncbi:MAG: hypothetical protein IKE58_04490 [Blautia sp.]|nr:hypothetical protein [Blautia sp.]